MRDHDIEWQQAACDAIWEGRHFVVFNTTEEALHKFHHACSMFGATVYQEVKPATDRTIEATNALANAIIEAGEQFQDKLIKTLQGGKSDGK